MITVELLDITPSQETELREWLQKPSFEILQRILFSKAKTLAAKGLNEALTGAPQKIELGNSYVQDAEKWEDAAIKLSTLKAQPALWKVVKLS